MIQHESIVSVADNTGAKLGLVFGIVKGNAKVAGVGDIVTLAIKQASSTSSIKKGDVVRGVVVRTKNKIRRKDGTYISFSDNAVAIVDKAGEPLGKRIFGPVAKELREKGRRNIAILAEEII